LNHLAADSKIPNRVTLSGIWYYGCHKNQIPSS
jgi:hypothetical protein